jgi:F0F1-type ATP synthase assembly protein I
VLAEGILQVRAVGIHLSHGASKSQPCVAQCVVLRRELVGNKLVHALVDGYAVDDHLGSSPLLLCRVVVKGRDLDLAVVNRTA